MNKRVLETINKNKDRLKTGIFIDAYNQSINEICGTICVGINFRNHYWVVVSNGKNKDKASNKERIH